MSVRVLPVVLSVLAVVLVMSATGSAPAARATVDVPVLAHSLAQDSEESSSSRSSDSSESSGSSEDGPALDPQTEAEAEKNRSKIVVGVIAAVLLGLVAWGRYVRSKKAKGG